MLKYRILYIAPWCTVFFFQHLFLTVHEGTAIIFFHQCYCSPFDSCWKIHFVPFGIGRICRESFFYMYSCLSFHPETVYFHISGTYTSWFPKKKVPPHLSGSTLNPSLTHETQIPNRSKAIRKSPWSASHFVIRGM
jgi:hypothetical protein